MTEQDALQQMIAPGTKRPRIWSGGVLQFWITRSCDLACVGCTQGSNLAGKSATMTTDQFETAVKSMAGYWGVFGVFGGNAALAKNFGELTEVLKAHVPFEQRGVWCNHPRGKGPLMRGVFNPEYSNINVHLVREAYDEFVRDWPECKHVLKGLDPSWPEAKAIKNRSEYQRRVGDSRHSPPFVAMQDLDMLPFPDGSTRPNTEENRWELIAGCDINKYWSALIGVFRGELRAWFCEIAAAQAMLHQANPDYPDTGLPVTPGWWQQPMQAFAEQVRVHCHACGIPLRGYGDLAVAGSREQVSKTHADIYQLKRTTREVELVELSTQLGEKHLKRATDYVENGKLPR